MIYKMTLMKINELKEHKEIDPFHLKELMEKIKSDGILKKPIAVDKDTKIVLDGAHKLNALKALGYKKSLQSLLITARQK
jgi:ParB-like chromosome segregation protein Spo0J